MPAIQNRTLDARMAALCWLLIENHTSLFAASGPQRAGKTTLLTALMAFLPPGAAPVFPAGQEETFSFTETADPAHTWIMVNELSDHLPVYLWGPPAARLFALIEQGYAAAATLHADTADEVIAYLAPP
ncbi:MAG: type II secretion system protein E, partial [Chloroflexi bacterium]|nr:type II secretion system protein E [Chloroflexota bacterium]